jgi:hypothetical protein
MKQLSRGKMVYAYKEVGSGSPPLVFVHGGRVITASFHPKSITSAGIIVLQPRIFLDTAPAMPRCGNSR